MLRANPFHVTDLSVRHVDQMFALMDGCYENVRRDAFERDLHEKEWAIVLERDGRVRGFSTLLFYEHATLAGPVRVVFSGDTVIEPASWGTSALPVAWVRLVMSLNANRRNMPLYWFLICKGYKTYRYLPVFLKTFYPSVQAAAPSFEGALMADLARSRYPGRFDAGAGIVRGGPECDRLRAGVATITSRHRKDPHVAFFERANPRHAEGDELVCLASLCRENFRPFILRSLPCP